MPGMCHRDVCGCGPIHVCSFCLALRSSPWLWRSVGYLPVLCRQICPTSPAYPQPEGALKKGFMLVASFAPRQFRILPGALNRGTDICAAQRAFLKPGGVAARHMHDIASPGHRTPSLLGSSAPLSGWGLTVEEDRQLGAAAISQATYEGDAPPPTLP